jgi:hypothetical protein
MQCTATRKATGQQCGRAAIQGGNVCWVHGGAAPQVRAAALRRIHSLVDTALEVLAEQMDSDDQAIAQRAAINLLDRAGYKAPEKITLIPQVSSDGPEAELERILSNIPEPPKSGDAALHHQPTERASEE